MHFLFHTQKNSRIYYNHDKMEWYTLHRNLMKCLFTMCNDFFVKIKFYCTWYILLYVIKSEMHICSFNRNFKMLIKNVWLIKNCCIIFKKKACHQKKKLHRNLVKCNNLFTIFFRENKILLLLGGGITRHLMILHALMDYLSKKGISLIFYIAF